MIKKGVFRPVHHDGLSDEQRKKILRSIMFLKLKRDGRLKARLVADGRLQAFFGTESEVSSPPASAESVFLTLAVDAAEEREVVVADIEGAYLEAYMEEEVLMEVDGDLAAVIVEMMPQWASFLRSNNKLTLVLVKALYGCIQSARRFYELLASVLCSIGFSCNPYDQCVFNKTSEDGLQCTIVVYVDDLKRSAVLVLLLWKALSINCNNTSLNLHSREARSLSILVWNWTSQALARYQ